MNNNRNLVSALTEIQLGVAKAKLKACENSTINIRRLHIDMLNSEIEVLEKVISGLDQS